MLFHGRGRNGKRHPLALAPCGSIRASGENGQHSGAQPLSGALQRQLFPFWHFVPPPPAGGVFPEGGAFRPLSQTLRVCQLSQGESQDRGGHASCLFFERAPRAYWECFLPLPLGEVDATNGSRRRGRTRSPAGSCRRSAEGPINRRCAKNAFSEAASIFPLRQLLWGLKGASSPWRRVAAPSIRFVPWAALASCWPLPQQLLPVSAAGGGRSCCIAGWVESSGASCTLRRKRSTLPSAMNKFKRQRQKVETFSPIGPFHCTRWQNVLK